MTDKFIFVWDSDSSRSLRKRIFPQYKVKDENLSQEEIELNAISYPQFIELRRSVLPRIGFQNIFIQAGYEADDIIAKFVLCNGNESVVISRDNDLYQLLDYCSMFNIDDKKMFTKMDFVKEYNIEPSRWADVKAIAGCNSDKIPNVSKVKEMTAIKYLKGELPKHHKTYQNIVSDEGQRTIERNDKLVRLPFENTMDFQYEEDEIYVEDFIDVCHSYDLKVFANTSKLDRWKSAFNMK